MKHYNYISFLLLFMSFLLAADLTPCMAVSPQKAKTKVVAKRPVAKTVKKRPVSKTVKKRPASSLSPAQTLIRKAQSGDAEAQYELGRNYYYGRENFPKDLDKGIMWWKKAAAQNYAEACYILTLELKDEEEKLFYARKGASQNNADCYKQLCSIYKEKEEYKHLLGPMYLKAVELGIHGGTFASLGMAYQYGDCGLPKDKSKALFWYKKHCDYLYSDYLESGDTFYYENVQLWQKSIKEDFNCDYDPALHVDEYKRWLKERTKPSDGGSSPRRSVASSVSSGTMRYHYTKSGRGQSQNTGQWTDSSGPEECNVEFGDNGITINGIYY
ncbi:MAG: sel1 repeat family protein [Prevotella sp.]|nr:sel1 repeat family protein [Prevotella sp.]